MAEAETWRADSGVEGTDFVYPTFRIGRWIYIFNCLISWRDWNLYWNL